MSTVNQEMMASWAASGGAIAAAASISLVDNCESEVQAAGGTGNFPMCIDSEVSGAGSSAGYPTCIDPEMSAAGRTGPYSPYGCVG